MRSFKEVVLPDGMLTDALRVAGRSSYITRDQMEDFLKRVLYFKQLSNIYHRNVVAEDGINMITEKVRRSPCDTYFLNKKGYKVTQNTGRARSLSDIYRICRSYHPNVKLHDVMNRMLNAQGYNYCGAVRKLVFHPIFNYNRDGYGWGRDLSIRSPTEFSRSFLSNIQYSIIKGLDL